MDGNGCLEQIGIFRFAGRARSSRNGQGGIKFKLACREEVLNPSKKRVVIGCVGRDVEALAVRVVGDSSNVRLVFEHLQDAIRCGGGGNGR